MHVALARSHGRRHFHSAGTIIDRPIDLDGLGMALLPLLHHAAAQLLVHAAHFSPFKAVFEFFNF
jgi:hypothetical protein